VVSRRFTAEPHAPKYRQVWESLSKDILSGKYQAGQKLPSEAALVQQFGTSRITVGRAMRELVERGLVERIAGSGSYVRQAHRPSDGLVFGLLIPELGNTEIFEPICRGIAAAPQAAEHASLWGHVESEAISPEAQALQLCDQFIRKHVSGVFLAPIETGAEAPETNLKIVSRLEKERIPIILLDRCVLPYPNRSHHDLVGIDNRRAGYMATEHLVKLGCRRISLVAYVGGAPTVEARITGFREAMLAHGLSLSQHIHRLPTITESSVRRILGSKNGEGFVCANDRTAGQLMQVLLGLGHRIPKDVRIVGIDDVEYASLLPVPLTTIHQPCREIGEAAMAAMLERVARPAQFVRDILVECRLVIRASCGANLPNKILSKMQSSVPHEPR
jgi:GntR family transcriptional regulator, arabinose operon transcriptional repressor